MIKGLAGLFYSAKTVLFSSVWFRFCLNQDFHDFMIDGIVDSMLFGSF